MSATKIDPGVAEHAQLHAAATRASLVPLLVAVGVALVYAFNVNYFLVSMVQSGDRYAAAAIAPEFPVVLLAMLAAIPFVSWRPGMGTNVGLLSAFALIAFVAWSAAVAAVVHGSYRAPVTLGVLVGTFAFGFGLARFAAERTCAAFARWLPLLPLLTLAAMSFFLAVGRLEFEAGFMKPQIVGGIRSSEIAIFVGLQALYCLYALDLRDARTSARARLGLVVSTLLLAWLLSWASIGALIAIAWLRTRVRSADRRRSNMMGVVAFVAVVGVALAPAAQSALVEIIEAKAEDYSEEGVRLPTLLLLISYIVENPFAGIGLGEFVARSVIPGVPEGLYPHNNVLGLAAELGLPAAALHTAFVSAVLLAGWQVARGAKSSYPGHVRCLALLAFCCFLYLHVKGLVQDTWQLKEGYFWAGLICGLSRGASVPGPSTRSAALPRGSRRELERS